MAKIDAAAVKKFLADLPVGNNIVCALQTWYEGLGGQGVPNPAQMSEIQDAIAAAGWSDVGVTRFEKFGMQPSYKRP